MTKTHQETGLQKIKKKSRENGSRDADDRLRDFPERLEECADNLEDAETPAPAHVSPGLRSGKCYASGLKIKQAQYLYSVPK